MEGWIKLHRSCLDHWLYTENRSMTKREAWETILFTVNYSESKVLIKGELYACARGQSLFSLQTWGNKFNWSIQSVRTFFKLLEVDNMIKIEGLRYTTLLTVCNYDKYQDCQQTDNRLTTDQQQTDNRLTTDCQQTDNKLLTTIEEDKENKEDKELFPIPKPIKKPKSQKCLMRNSPVYELSFLIENIGLEYSKFDLNWYHKSLLNWSDSKGEHRADWLAVIRGAILRDEKESRAKLKVQTQQVNAR